MSQDDFGTNALPVLDRARLDAGLAQLERDRADLEALTITSAQMNAAVGAVLIEALKQHDALKAERDRVVMPIHAAYKNASETYAPHLKASEACIAALKKAIGAWERAELARKAEAFALAQAATQVAITYPAEAEEAHAVVTAALDVAAQSTGKAAGVGVRFEWRVKRFDSADPRMSMLESKYWEPNMQAIEQEADRQAKEGTPGGGVVNDQQPPIIPGVVFDLVPCVSGRRRP